MEREFHVKLRKKHLRKKQYNLPFVTRSHALRGQGSDRPHLLDVSSDSPPPPFL